MGVFNRFKADQGGSVAAMFGVAALPLIGLIGAAVDYSRAANERAKLQRAIDATVLTLVREPRTSTPAQLSAKAGTVLAALYPVPPGVSVEPPSVRRSGESILVSAKGSMTNAFMQLVGLRDTPFGAESQVASSQERIELALVLDNTGSMADRIGSKVKIEELRTAALKLVKDLRGIMSGPDDVRLSVVPFDTEVRVDANRYRYRDWLRWQNGGTQAERNGWTGYVVDRYAPKDVTDDRPVMALPDTRYTTLPASEWAAKGKGDLAPVQPLTSLYGQASFDAVNATIRTMQPRGNTNVGLGVSWGTATLTGSVPLDTSSTGDPRAVKRYMVVLTDGTNTQKWVDGEACTPSGSGCRISVSAMNTRTNSACDTAKASGIEVFTIRLLDGDKALLGGCASPPNSKVKQHYFDVQSADQLQAAFDSILGSITATRLTH